MDISVAATASLADVVARSFLPATASAITASRPGSTNGDLPSFTMATLSALTSTPITSWPSRARQAAITAPTWPKPKTLTLIVPPETIEDEANVDRSRDLQHGLKRLRKFT